MEGDIADQLAQFQLELVCTNKALPVLLLAGLQHHLALLLIEGHAALL